MQMSPNKGETAIHGYHNGYHCLGDMHMCAVLAMQSVGLRVLLALSFS